MPLAKNWIDASATKEQDVGVFFFVLLASLSLGIVVSGIRSILLDPLYHKGGLGLKPIPRPVLRFSELSDQQRFALFEGIVENYYKYYQFYANTLIALLFLILAHETSAASPWPISLNVVLGLSLLALFISARNSLSQYATAVTQLLPERSTPNAEWLAAPQTQEGQEKNRQEGKTSLQAGPEKDAQERSEKP